MDIGRLVQMVVNMFLRKAVSKGVNLAVDRMGKARPGGASPGDDAQTAAARDAVKRARKAASLTRKIGR